MSVRDHAAVLFVQAMLVEAKDSLDPEKAANTAYYYADALVRRSEEQAPVNPKDERPRVMSGDSHVGG